MKWGIEYRELIVRGWSGKKLCRPIKERYKKYEGTGVFATDIVLLLRDIIYKMRMGNRSFTVHARRYHDGEATPEHLRIAQVKWGYNNMPYISIDYAIIDKIIKGGNVDAHV